MAQRNNTSTAFYAALSVDYDKDKWDNILCNYISHSLSR